MDSGISLEAKELTPVPFNFKYLMISSNEGIQHL